MKSQMIEILITKESDFNRFASLIDEKQVEVKDGQVIVVEFEGTILARQVNF